MCDLSTLFFLLKVITYDARNHGDSEHTTEFNFSCMAEDLNDLIDDLGLSEPFVMGHSMGGKTAMTLALTKVRLMSSIDSQPNLFNKYSVNSCLNPLNKYSVNLCLNLLYNFAVKCSLNLFKK